MRHLKFAVSWLGSALPIFTIGKKWSEASSRRSKFHHNQSKFQGS
jgi:hypothetical protein